MKSRYYFIAIWATLCLSCSKEFLNDCDQESPAFKTVNAAFETKITNNVVSFKNNSANADNYSWEFGDGTTSTVFEPNKPFAYRDTPYTVKLIASRCGGERQSTISKTIDVKCTTKAPEIEVDKKTICSGEVATLRLKTACASGSSVKWSTGATSNTLAVSASGKYTAQCMANCPSVASNEIEVTVNPKPNQPTVSGTLFKVCNGSSFNLPNNTCNLGNVVWSDGSSGLSITPSKTTEYTINCNNNGCQSSNSIPFTLNIFPSNGIVETIEVSYFIFAGINISVIGLINFYTNNVEVEDRGIIYKELLTTQNFKIGEEGVKILSYGPISHSETELRIHRTIRGERGKSYSAIAYMKDCTGYKYGSIKSITIP